MRKIERWSRCALFFTINNRRHSKLSNHCGQWTIWLELNFDYSFWLEVPLSLLCSIPFSPLWHTSSLHQHLAVKQSALHNLFSYQVFCSKTLKIVQHHVLARTGRSWFMNDDKKLRFQKRQRWQANERGKRCDNSTFRTMHPKGLIVNPLIFQGKSK